MENTKTFLNDSGFSRPNVGRYDIYKPCLHNMLDMLHWSSGPMRSLCGQWSDYTMTTPITLSPLHTQETDGWA